MSDEPTRNEPIETMVRVLREQTDDNFDGIYELIDRITTGNPRLTKKEIALFKKFLFIVSEHMQAQTDVMVRFKQLWEAEKDVRSSIEKTTELQATIIKHLEELLRRRGGLPYE